MINQAGIDLIKKFEGFRAKPYLCPAGKWTIGYGTTRNVTKELDEITIDQAEQLLLQDISFIESDIKKMVKVPLTENQLAALIAFAYNVGINALKNSTLLKKLNAFDRSGASSEFLKWDKYTNPKTGKKEPLAGLTKRRQAEMQLFLKV
jgi:lysozyme